jgi:hypothetical protein
MPPRIIVDEEVPTPERPRIVDVVGAALRSRKDSDSLIAVVTKLPSGRLTVFVNHVDDPDFVSTIEAALAKLR